MKKGEPRGNILLSYRHAIRKISRLIDGKYIKDSFDGSTILAHLYELEKETTLEDLGSFRISGQ